MYDYKIVDGANVDKAAIGAICNNRIAIEYINNIQRGVSVGVLGFEEKVVGVVVYTIHGEWTLIHLFCAPKHAKQLQFELERSGVPKHFALSSILEQKVTNSYQALGYTATYNDLPIFHQYLGNDGVIMTKGGRRLHLKLPLKVRKTRRQRRLVPKYPARKRTGRVRS